MKNQLVYVIESDSNFAQELLNTIENLSNFKVNIFKSVETAMIYAQIEPPSIVFFEANRANASQEKIIKAWKNKFPATKLAIIGNNKNINALRTAYEKEVSKFILKEGDLNICITETLNLINKKTAKF